MGDRNTFIGGSVSGSAIVSGDANAVDVNSSKATLPAAASVDIETVLTGLKQLLSGMQTDHRQKIVNALTEAIADAAKPQPDRDEVGRSLERALSYASKAADFGDKAGRIACHVQDAVGWLGYNWHKLLPLVGLTF